MGASRTYIWLFQILQQSPVWLQLNVAAMVQAFGELAVVLTALGCLSKVVLTAAVTHQGCFVASGLWICSTLETSSSDVTIFWKKTLPWFFCCVLT